MWSVKSPSIPWSTPTPGGFNCKGKIKIYGVPKDSRSKQFSIKFDSDDKSLIIQMDGFIRHRRDRRESTVSVLSALSNDVELCQENTICITNQIVIGAEFMLKIKAVNHVYSVHLNHNPICSFTAHILSDQIHAFNIDGDVNIDKIKFYHFPRINMAYKTFTHAGRWNEVLNGGFHCKMIDIMGRTKEQQEDAKNNAEQAKEQPRLNSRGTTTTGNWRRKSVENCLDSPVNNIEIIEPKQNDGNSNLSKGTSVRFDV